MIDYRGWYVVGLSLPFGWTHPLIISLILKSLIKILTTARGGLDATVGGVKKEMMGAPSRRNISASVPLILLPLA